MPAKAGTQNDFQRRHRVMRLPVIEGIIRRRILVNYRVAPEIIQRLLPSRFRPKLHEGQAIAGICLIRLEHIRPKVLPEFIGLNSENAAHRIAVRWEDEHGRTQEGVFIPRRDTNSEINHIMGGRIFPGEHNKASFDVQESGQQIDLSMESQDGTVNVRIAGVISDTLPASSIFRSLSQASEFFEGGSLGYSVTGNSHRLDGIRLETKEWRVEPLNLERVFSSYFNDSERFPVGSFQFDHALIMRNIAHEWHSSANIYV